MIAVAAFLGAGCGREVRCLHWNGDDGSCPAPASAERTFRALSPTCDAVEFVDRGGEFDGDSCCYEVSERDECAAR